MDHTTELWYRNFWGAEVAVRRAYRELLFRDPYPDDTPGMAGYQRAMVEQGLTEQQMRENIMSSSEYKEKHPAHADFKIRGYLRTDGRGFMDDTGYRNVAAIHGGDLFCAFTEGLNVEPEIRSMGEAGYDLVRWWLTLNVVRDPNSWWTPRFVGPGITPQYWERAREFCDMLTHYGLSSHVAPGDLRGVDDNWENDLFDGIADLMADIGPERFALVEGLNEARDTGDRDDEEPSEIERLVNRVREQHPSNLYALSAFTGHEDRDTLLQWTPGWMRFVLYHALREGHMHDKIRHMFSMTYEDPIRRLYWSGEPWGWGPWVSVVENQHEIDAEAYELQAAICTMARTVPTFMSSPGVIFDRPFSAVPGFREFPAMVRALPKDVMTWDQLFHGGTSHRDKRVFAASDPARIDQAIDTSTGRMMAVAYGPSGTYHFPVERRVMGEVMGDPTVREYPTGSTLSLTFRHGRIFQGQLL